MPFSLQDPTGHYDEEFQSCSEMKGIYLTTVRPKKYFTSPTHEYFGASTSSTEAAAMYLSDIAKQEKFLNLEKKEKLSKVAKQAVINDDPCFIGFNIK